MCVGKIVYVCNVVRVPDVWLLHNDPLISNHLSFRRRGVHLKGVPVQQE